MQLQYLDHYRLLCIADNATSDDVERAYRKAMAEIPSDLRGRLIAQLKGKTARRFTAAYGELIDPVKRAEYDAYLDRVKRTPLCRPLF